MVSHRITFQKVWMNDIEVGSDRQTYGQTDKVTNFVCEYINVENVVFTSFTDFNKEMLILFYYI